MEVSEEGPPEELLSELSSLLLENGLLEELLDFLLLELSSS